MGLSGWTRAGIGAGGVSKGITGGLAALAEMARTENETKRTDIMGQELDIRKKTAQRTEEEYQRGMEPISIEDARKSFAEPEVADYHEGFARSIGAIRKKEDGTEYITRKDAREIAVLMKSPELQKDMNDYQINALRDKLAKAEQDEKEQPELKPTTEALKRRLEVAHHRAGYKKEEPKVVPKGSRLVDSAGKVILDADEKDKDITSNVGVNPKSGKKEFLFKDGSFSGVEATKVKGEGSDLADEIRRERLAMAKDDAERKRIDEQYKRKERLDDDWEREEKEYRKQYEDDLEVEEEPGVEKGYRAKTNWNANMATLRKKYKSRYEAIGLDLQGNPIRKEGQGTGLAGMQNLPAKMGDTTKPSTMPGKKGETIKPTPLGQKAQLFQKPDGSTVAIGPDGKERPVKIEGNKVKFLQ